MTPIRQGDITGFDDAEVVDVETEDTDDKSNSKSHSV